MIVREAEARHADGIAALHVASWRDAYRAILDREYLSGPLEAEKQALWRDRLAAADPCLGVMVALDRDGLAGCICLRLAFDHVWGALIDNLHTEPTRRSRGVGAMLLRAAAATIVDRSPASGLHLYVFAANIAARRFYERHGARSAGSIASHIPSARGAPVLRLHWPSARDVT